MLQIISQTGRDLLNLSFMSFLKLGSFAKSKLSFLVEIFRKRFDHISQGA
jgi:hypothetical protein